MGNVVHLEIDYYCCWVFFSLVMFLIVAGVFIWFCSNEDEIYELVNRNVSEKRVYVCLFI